MSVRRLAAEQPEDFAFTPENLAWAKEQLQKDKYSGCFHICSYRLLCRHNEHCASFRTRSLFLGKEWRLQRSQLNARIT